MEIEAALVRHGHVPLRAVAGAGKTAAATEFARWYARTGGCGVAGPVSLADAPADALRGLPADRPLLLWDDARALTGEHRALLAEIAAAGGRVLVIADRPVELPGRRRRCRDRARARRRARQAPARPRAGDRAGGPRARRGGEDIESVIAELADPDNGDPASWTVALGEQVQIAGSRAETLVAQFRGYPTVIGFAMLRDGGNDLDAAEAELMELRARGILTRISDAAFAIHPGLAVALAVAGRYEALGRAFVEAMARTMSAWTGIAEMHGAEAPWPAERSEPARRAEVGQPRAVVAAGRPAARRAQRARRARRTARRLARRAVRGRFVDPETGGAAPRDGGRLRFVGHLASLAELEGDYAKEAQMRAIDVRHRRAAFGRARRRARAAQRGGVRAGPARRRRSHHHAQSRVRDPGAVATMREAIQLAQEIGEWRLEALEPVLHSAPTG